MSANRVTKGESVKPNILLIGVDQMRADTPGFLGLSPCKTPNIDNLAKSGLAFTHAYTPCSLCSPARASLFTGDYAFKHGMGTNCDMYHILAEELQQPERLMHHRLTQEGYRCGYIGKWHVGKESGPCDHGFEGMNMPGYGDIIHDPEFLQYQKDHGYTYSLTEPIFGNHQGQTLLAGCWKGETASTPAHYLADRTIELMKDFSSPDTKQPFLLTCQFWGPHMPHLPSTQFYKSHDRDLIEPWCNAEDSWEGKPGIVKRLGSDFYRDPPKDWSAWAELIGCYYDYTSMIDHEIGRIHQALKEFGLEDSTMILFTSDHGDMTGSHGGLLDKGFLYEEAHRVPLIVSGPGITQNRVCDQLVMNMDIFPTILDYLSIEHTDRDGRSFLSCLVEDPVPTQQNALRKQVYLEFHGLRFLYSQRALVSEDHYTYIFTPGDQDELYDLKNDPGELKNLIDDLGFLDKKKELQDLILQEAKKYKDPLVSCMAKLFGDWGHEDGQPNPTRL